MLFISHIVNDSRLEDLSVGQDHSDGELLFIRRGLMDWKQVCVYRYVYGNVSNRMH
jgi:hypothetical protein